MDRLHDTDFTDEVAAACMELLQRLRAHPRIFDLPSNSLQRRRLVEAECKEIGAAHGLDYKVVATALARQMDR